MTGETRNQRAKLSQFHLDFSLATMCAPRKNVEDQLIRSITFMSVTSEIARAWAGARF